MIWKKTAFLFVLVICISCSDKEISVIGTYRTEISLGDKISSTLQDRGWISGTTLELHPDSTFRLTNCALFIDGNWSKRGDSVFLATTKKHFRNDSLNSDLSLKSWTKAEKKPTAFHFENGHLRTVYITPEGETLESLAKIPASE